MNKFKKWIDNYWYHYKWHTILTTVFGLFIIISTVQFFSRTTPDANIMYAGPASVTYTSLDEIRNSFAKIIKDDYSGDHKKAIDYVEITLNDRSKINSDGEIYSEYVQNDFDFQGTMLERYNAEIAFGDSLVYLLSPKIYEDLKFNLQLIPLVSERLLGYIPETAFDEYSLRLGEMEIYKCKGISLLPADTILCMRDPDTTLKPAKTSKNTYQSNANVFKDMVEFVYV